MTFPDHFSEHSQSYLAYRPTYPAELFGYLDSLVGGHDLAWDCATGNGQAAFNLTPYFRHIVASDGSPQQLSLARVHERIAYVVALASRSPLGSGSVDLVTVASAFHWLDCTSFFAEVRRVAKPGAILAVWGYKLASVSPEVDAAIKRLDVEVLRDFWLPETRLAAEGYKTIPFPFDEIAAPPFTIHQQWSLEHLLGFLSTWSASLRYQAKFAQNPTDEIREQAEAAWGDPGQTRLVTWDLHMRLGRVNQR